MTLYLIGEHGGGSDSGPVVNEPEPSYWAVMPGSVRADKKISAQAKLLYLELTALVRLRGYAWSSNRWLAARFDVSTDTISRWLQELTKAGHIEIEIDRPAGNRRHIYLSETLPAKMRQASRKYAVTSPQIYGGHLNKDKVTNKKERLIAPTKLFWSAPTGWSGVTDELRTELKAAYPACDIERQFRQAALWLKSNPAKAKKSNWLRFITGWLKKEQDRGGDLRATTKGRTYVKAKEAAPVGPAYKTYNPGAYPD